MIKKCRNARLKEGIVLLLSKNPWLITTLADNGVRYTPPGIRIDLVADETVGYVRISVEDNGTGIAATERAGVCEPFYRIPGTEQGGTGLGLSIVFRNCCPIRRTAGVGRQPEF